MNTATTNQTTPEIKIGSIVKISKTHLENNHHTRKGGHNRIGKIVSIGLIGCIVSVHSNGYYSCDLSQVTLFDGQVSNQTKNLPIPRKMF
jgi:hypothetical protein